jgi:hypothetical protein
LNHSSLNVSRLAARRRTGLLAHCLLALCLLALCLLAHCLLAHCLLAHCLLAHCLLAHCLLAHCLLAHCLLAHCLLAHCLLAPPPYNVVLSCAGARDVRHPCNNIICRGMSCVIFYVTSYHMFMYGDAGWLSDCLRINTLCNYVLCNILCNVLNNILCTVTHVVLTSCDPLQVARRALNICLAD